MRAIVEKIRKGRREKYAIRDRMSGLYYQKGGKWGRSLGKRRLYDTPGEAHTKLAQLEEREREAIATGRRSK